MSAGALDGARAALRGTGPALRSPEVRRTCLHAALAVVALTLFLYAAAAMTVWQLVVARQPGVATVLLAIAASLIVLVASPVVAWFLVNLLVPLLAERIFLAGLRELAPERAKELAGLPGLTLPQSVGISLRRLGRYVVLTVAILAFSWIPVIGSIGGPLLQLLHTARTLGGELLDPYLSRLGLLWPAQRAVVVRHRAPLIGFALPWVPALAIPFVGPLIFAVAQAAIASLVVEIVEPELRSARERGAAPAPRGPALEDETATADTSSGRAPEAADGDAATPPPDLQ